MARGDGATTRQMKAAPIGSHFVWVNHQLAYPNRLARKIGRDDLEIVTPDFFHGHRWQGIRFVDIIIDHTARLSDEAIRNVAIARSHSIRSLPQHGDK